VVAKGELGSKEERNEKVEVEFVQLEEEFELREAKRMEARIGRKRRGRKALGAGGIGGEGARLTGLGGLGLGGIDGRWEGKEEEKRDGEFGKVRVGRKRPRSRGVPPM